jgi:endonuclease/exonuclease/phosphatase family metal-dependent hydrolase
MRITSWNFLHGQPIQPGSRASLEEALKALDSDLIGLQEIDLGLARSGGRNQVAECAAAMGASYWGFAPTLRGTPGFSWRKIKREELSVITDKASDSSELYGVAIASKIPVRKWLRLELGKAWIGLPLLVANEKGKVAPFYVKDEPRVALAAVLENGWTVINTHLSFVPLVNIFQLLKITRWANKLEREYSTKVILLGDFNLPWGLPTRVTKWKRATNTLTYPSWRPAISFDYILMRERDMTVASELKAPEMAISDHRPLTINLSVN